VEIFAALCHTGAPTGIPLLRMFTLARRMAKPSVSSSGSRLGFKTNSQMLSEIRFLGLHYKAFAETKSAGWLIGLLLPSQSQGDDFMADNVSEPAFSAFVALDWADKKHAFALVDAATGERQTGFLDHTPEQVQAWAGELIARFGPAPIAVCLEQSRGPLVSMLLQFENFVVYPVAPQTVAKLRQAFYGSGSKHDPLDADLLLDILRHHRRHPRRLVPDTVEIRKLQLLVADRRDLAGEKTRHKNRLTDRLKQY